MAGEQKQNIMDGKIIGIEEKLANYQGEDKIISSFEMEKLLGDKSKPEIQFNSKIPSFDRLCEGFEGGELVVIGGPTGHGKTSLAQTFTENFEEQNIHSLWFSYEVMPKQFFRKFNKLPLFYLPQVLKGKTINWLNARIWEAKLKYDTRAVFIDHLHFLVDLEKIRNPSIEIGQIMRGLKTMAIRHNIVIFLIAHLQKIKLEEEPDNEHLRDSSFIAQESDCVLMIWRRKINGEFNNEAIMKVAKHRRNGIMGKKIKLIYDKQKFSELAEEL